MDDKKEIDLAEVLKGADLLQPPTVDVTCSICSQVELVRWQVPCKHEVCLSCLENNTDECNEFICPLHGTVSQRSEIVKRITSYKEIGSLTVRCKNKSRGCFLTVPLSQLKVHERVCPMQNSAHDQHLPKNGPHEKVSLRENGPVKKTQISKEVESLKAENRRLQESVDEVTERYRILAEENTELWSKVAKNSKEVEVLQEQIQNLKTSQREPDPDATLPLINMKESGQYICMEDNTQTLPLINMEESGSYVSMDDDTETDEKGTPELLRNVKKNSKDAGSSLELPELSVEEENEYVSIQEDIEEQLCTQERPSIGWLNWQIHPWSSMKQQCVHPKVLYSPPLYSHTFGYKFRLSVIAGDDFRVYIRLVKGENDEKLRWPFKGKVTVSLVNSKVPHKKNNLHCPIDAKKPWFSKFFQKPTDSTKEESLLCFSPPLKDVENHKKGFFHNDTLTIRVVVVPQ